MRAHIRLADDADLTRLAALEAAADTAFDGVLDSSAWGAPPSGHARLTDPGFILVIAEEASGPAVGFAHVIEDGATAYLEQVSVHPGHARQGHGRTLVRAVIAEASARGFARVTLRTYADVPWNAPFYASLGFEERPAPGDGFQGALTATEERLGLARQGRRVHMELPLAPGGTVDQSEARMPRI